MSMFDYRMIIEGQSNNNEAGKRGWPHWPDTLVASLFIFSCSELGKYIIYIYYIIYYIYYIYYILYIIYYIYYMYPFFSNITQLLRIQYQYISVLSLGSSIASAVPGPLRPLAGIDHAAEQGPHLTRKVFISHTKPQLPGQL